MHIFSLVISRSDWSRWKLLLVMSCMKNWVCSQLLNDEYRTTRNRNRIHVREFEPVAEFGKLGYGSEDSDPFNNITDPEHYSLTGWHLWMAPKDFLSYCNGRSYKNILLSFILSYMSRLFRLTMFLTDSNNIKEVLFFPAMKPEDNKPKEESAPLTS